MRIEPEKTETDEEKANRLAIDAHIKHEHHRSAFGKGHTRIFKGVAKLKDNAPQARIRSAEELAALAQLKIDMRADYEEHAAAKDLLRKNKIIK